MTDERQKTLRLYADVFSTENGRAVLDDVLNAYHHRLSMAVEAEVANIDHPYRLYYIEGQRSVARALQDIVTEALMARGGDSGG